MIAQFDRFSIKMTKAQAQSCHHPGPCDADVQILLETPNIKRQLAKISDESLAMELHEYGTWDEDALESRADNNHRIIWIAACDIAEGNGYAS